MERHYFPLLHEQMVVVGWASMAPAQLLNLPVRVEILEEIDEERMLEAYRLTVERLPYCRVRLHKLEDGSTVQYVSDLSEQTFCELLDYTNKSERQVGKQVSKWAGTPFENKLMDVQLHTAKLLRRKDGTHTFYFCAPHTIMDIYAVSYVVRYLDEVYYALTTGTELPKVGGDPEILALRDQELIASARCRENNDWWHEVYRTEPQFTSVNGVTSREFIKGKWYGKGRSLLQMRAKELSYRIPAELVEALDALAQRDHMSAYMYYYLAVRCYLGAVSHTDDVVISSLIMNRATLAEKSGGLSKANGFDFRTVLDGTETFRDAAVKSSCLHQEYLKHLAATAVTPCPRDRFPRPEGTEYATTMLSYVPYVDYRKIHLKVKANKIDSRIAIGCLYILLMPMDASGDLWAMYQYAAGYIKPKNVEKLHAFMLRFLQAGLDDPEATIGALTDKAM